MIEPMLAAAVTADDLSKLEYPVWVQPKYDGIRAYKWEGNVYTRTGKPIRNVELREYLERELQDGYDFEILSPVGFGHTQSVVMSQEHPDTSDVLVLVFDIIDSRPFGERSVDVNNLSLGVLTSKVNTADEILDYYRQYIASGYEGIIIRGNRAYKHGRSTLAGQELLKMKPRDDMEATILEVLPLVRQDGTVEQMVGSLVCSREGVEFSIGTGLTREQRLELWRQDLIGKKVSFFGEPSTKTAPRFPVFHRIREDM